MKILQKVAILIIIIILPVTLVLTAVRICLTPTFLEVEYRLPGFPTDSYGFTLTERLHWAKISSAYLLDEISTSELASKYLPNGQPLYNAREIEHMQDVKNLTKAAFVILYCGLGFLVSLCIIAWLIQWQKDYWQAIQYGGKLTIFLIFALILGVLLNFNQIFTAFHGIFFESGTWLFHFNDTLIRLFPLRFWQDIFLFIGGVNLLVALFLIFFSKQLMKK
ncbi:MAG TPA: TIGR01906 family membrane protein [Anaerolineae bacterium]|nr:TIGR01906 family membrane protein [Anaerolineae bacterium]